ncbi:diacylglycerol kinase [Amylibacter ulvae]|uniref:Diacylglycerol kinase n=2 Tax=Paramylibacter TaxID=3143987 RepID=A0A2G5K4U2_9RHOB|nr:MULTISPECIES: diacylglycerol kinase [Amylibacter]PIB24043.1 hypothetical protein BFP76_01990 [Amylibacter kogurei]GHA50801.1 diacylglycerol kinase [Amylibacter ulvae]
MFNYVARESKRFITRCVNTWEGIAITWKDEASFPQWVVINIISITLTFVFPISTTQQALLIALGLLILVVELLNTAIEACIDRISDDIHPLSKKAKDAGCAAVALTAITGLIVWIIVLCGLYA